MKKTFCSLLSVTALLACLNGCEVEDYYLSDMNTDDLLLSTSVGSPVGNSNITIADLVEKQDIKGLGYDSTGMVVFTYDTTQHMTVDAVKITGYRSTVKKSGYDLLEDQMKELGISRSEFETGHNSSDYSVRINVPSGYKMPFTAAVAVKDILGSESGQRIDSIIFKKALVNVSFKTAIPKLLDNTSATISFRSKGKTISAETSTPANGITLDLGGATLDIDNADSIYFDGYLTAKNAFNTSIYSGSELNISVVSKEEDMDFDKVWGVFNNIDPLYGYNLIGVDLYEQNNGEGVTYNLQVVDPKINLGINTNIGVPFSIGIAKLNATNDHFSRNATFRDGSKTYVQDLSYAKTVGEDVVALTECFNKDNGKIDELVNMLPKEIGLEYYLNAKETDPDSKKNYFITSDAYIDVNCNVELPAYIKKGSYITVTDTIDDIEIGDDLGVKYTFETAKIMAEIENSLPFDAEINFYFMEDDGMGNISIIDDKSIQKSLSVESGTVDSKTHKVTSVSKTQQELVFTNKDIPSLKKAKHIFITYRIAVDDFDEVKVTKENALKVQLKAYAKGSVYINKF